MLKLVNKKQSTNGYFLFRKEIQSKNRAEGRRPSEDELKQQCDELWDNLVEGEREEWKMKAKEDRLKARSDTAAYIMENHRMPKPNPPLYSSSISQKPKSSRLQKESVLQAREELILATDPKQKSLKDRKTFENAFTWKYETDRKALRTQKFYLLSSSILHHCPNEECIPAEVACVEFTIEAGVTKHYCATVSARHNCIGANVEEEIKDLSQKTHQFTSMDLNVIGKSCQEIADRLIDMSHDREPSCGNVRFFVLNWEMNETLGALHFLLKNASLNDEYRNLGNKDVALIDDLAYGLFKFYDVDYPKPPANADSVDLSYLSDLIDGSNFRRVICDVHEDYDDGAVCCLSQLYLTVEVIRSCVENKKFDEISLTQFACSVDSSKSRYYEAPNFSQNVDNNELSNDQSLDEGDEIEKIIFKFHFYFNDFDEASEPTELEMSSDTLTGPNRAAYLPDLPSTVSCQPAELVGFKQLADARRVPVDQYVPRYSFGDVFLRPADTLPVQHLLPSGRRGFGRGIRLLPEGELLERLAGMKSHLL